MILAVLDVDSETFVMHVAIREQEVTLVHSKKQAQVEALLFNKVSTKIPEEYSDYSNIFLAENVAELPENTGMNEHAIELEEDKQPPFSPIYSLGQRELETLKTYIETNLANSFIRPFKSPAGAPIFWDRKFDKNLYFRINNQGFNNITIKNQYLLPLIGKLLDRLVRIRRFTHLDLTNAYYWMRICENDEWKTAFRIWYRDFEYWVMPFGLSNAPAIF